MLTKFQSMWDDHFGRISVAKPRIEILHKSIHTVHYAPYRAGPITRDFKKVEIEKSWSQKIIEPAQTEWAASFVFATENDGTLRLCIDYRKLNALTKRDTYQYRAWTNVSTLAAKP